MDVKSKFFAVPGRPELALCLAVFAVYASVWHNGFVFDDIGLIVGNDMLKHWSRLGALLTHTKLDGPVITGFCRPLQMLIYMLLYQLAGPSTLVFHALNVALQAVNALLLYRFGLRLGFKQGAVFAAALLWAVHPLHTINVAYVSSTAEELWSCFALLGLTALLPDFTPHKIYTAGGFFLLALCCKESAVVFPALAVAVYFLVSKDRAKAKGYLRLWPLWALSAAYIAIWLWYIHVTGFTLYKAGDMRWFDYYTGNFTNRIFTSLATLPVYAGLILWPAHLHVERVFPAFLTPFEWLPMTGIALVLLAGVQIIKGKSRPLSFGVLWFAIVLSPYSGIILPIDAIISEGWMYMPMMGLFLGVAQTLSGYLEKRQDLSNALVCATALVFGIATFQQAPAWRDTQTLYQSIADNGGDPERIGRHLALFYMGQGDFDKAVAQFQSDIAHPGNLTQVEQADLHWKLAMAWLHVPPDQAYTFTVDPHLLKTSPHIPEVISELGKVLQENPDYYWAHIVLAAIYHAQGNDAMAQFHLKQLPANFKN